MLLGVGHVENDSDNYVQVTIDAGVITSHFCSLGYVCEMLCELTLNKRIPIISPTTTLKNDLVAFCPGGRLSGILLKVRRCQFKSSCFDYAREHSSMVRALDQGTGYIIFIAVVMMTSLTF